MKRDKKILFVLLQAVLFSAPAHAAPEATRSIKEWAKCDGASDDTQAATRAFAEASHHAFKLVIDCPVRLNIGDDIGKTIFVDDGTTVEMNGAGKITVDNLFHPAFALANSHDITFANWDLVYDGILPIDGRMSGYRQDGVFVAHDGHGSPAGAFNDQRITKWLTANRHITFIKDTSMWVGPANTGAVFFIIGDTYHVRMKGMHIHVPPGAGGDRFIPFVFSFSANYKSNQSVTRETPHTGQFMAIPHDLEFADIDLDGTYMVWQGTVRDVTFKHIRSHRYGDVQDASGGNSGGVGKWFPPPHLFYLNDHQDWDPALMNRNIHITDVIDDGIRIGVARDKGGSDTLSGHALSLKIGCIDCSVDHYKSARPDGFIDVLPSDGMTISNVEASFDSSFLNGVFPGWRFPKGPYKNVTFKNIILKDMAAVTTHPPIAGVVEQQGEFITFKNVRVLLNQWAGQAPLLPAFLGNGYDIALDYIVSGSNTHLVAAQTGATTVTLQASPYMPHAGESALFTWASRNAAACGSGGSWNDVRIPTGKRTIKFDRAGDYSFGFGCGDAKATASVALPIHVAR